MLQTQLLISQRLRNAQISEANPQKAVSNEASIISVHSEGTAPEGARPLDLETQYSREAVVKKLRPIDTANVTDVQAANIEQAVSESATATPERAKEIAGMQKFSLPEFIELTGIGVGNYGIYNVSREGVTLPQSDLEHLTPSIQQSLLHAEQALPNLAFPCTPEAFVDWYDTTRGDNGTSDFPLAAGFLTALVGTKASQGTPQPSSAIIKAFRKDSDDNKNHKWWDDRLRAAKKYGLTEARALKGRAQQPSLWHPTLVAFWLIEKGYINRALVVKALETHFPDADTSFL